MTKSRALCFVLIFTLLLNEFMKYSDVVGISRFVFYWFWKKWARYVPDV